MNWNLSQLNWPQSAQAIQNQAETVTGKIDVAMSEAVDRLQATTFNRHELSVESEALLGLRAELNQLLQSGQILTVSPFQFQVGNKISSGQYLNPANAVKTLVKKLRDHADKNKPTGELYCVAVMVSESTLQAFASKMNELSNQVALPDWSSIALQADALTTNEKEKFYQPAAIVQPRFTPESAINSNPLLSALNLQGSQVATLESLANDKTTVIAKLSNLAKKRKDHLANVKQSINKLKQLTGSVWSVALEGTAESIAAQLSELAAPSNHQHTMATLLLSNKPLTFFKELFT